MHIFFRNITWFGSLLGNRVLKGPFSHKHQESVTVRRQSHEKKNLLIIHQIHFILFCTWLFSNQADSTDTVRNSNDNGKLSNFKIQNLDITKFWKISSILMFKFNQNLAIFKAWMAKLDNLPVSFELLTAFFESAVLQKSDLQKRMKWIWWIIIKWFFSWKCLVNERINLESLLLVRKWTFNAGYPISK